MPGQKYLTLGGIFQDYFHDTIRSNSNVLDYVNSDAASGQKNVVVSNGALFTIGQAIIFYDGTNFESAVIADKSGNTLTMVDNLTYAYTEGTQVGRFLGYIDSNNVKMQAKIGPDLGTGADGPFVSSGNETWSANKNYTSVTIQNGHTITINDNIVIKCQGLFNTQVGGIASTQSKGGGGGSPGSPSPTLPTGGTGGGPAGVGGGGGGSYNGDSHGQGGGGGGHATNGTAGSGYTGTGGGPGGGGDAYGSADLVPMYAGSGGGGGMARWSESGAGTGGAGAGRATIHCDRLIIAGTMNGNGMNGGNAGNEGGAGGGSGGSWLIYCNKLVTLGSNLITASGGSGGSGAAGTGGGAGAVGRIRIEAGKVTGTSSPTYGSGYATGGVYKNRSWYTTPVQTADREVRSVTLFIRYKNATSITAEASIVPVGSNENFQPMSFFKYSENGTYQYAIYTYALRTPGTKVSARVQLYNSSVSTTPELVKLGISWG